MLSVRCNLVMLQTYVKINVCPLTQVTINSCYSKGRWVFSSLSSSLVVLQLYRWNDISLPCSHFISAQRSTQRRSLQFHHFCQAMRILWNAVCWFITCYANSCKNVGSPPPILFSINRTKASKIDSRKTIKYWHSAAHCYLDFIP